MRQATSSLAVRPVATIDLQAYPSQIETTNVPNEILVNQLFTRPPAARITRQRFGRGLDLDRIQVGLDNANRGSMRQVTDISRETLDVDPHLSAVLNKRFSSLSSLPFEVNPAQGMGIDPERAMFYAEVVREQLNQLKNFRDNLKQLAWALFDGRACLELKWTQLNPLFSTAHPRFGRPTFAIESMSWVHPRRLSFGPRRELQIEDEEEGEFTGNFNRVGLQVDSLAYKFAYWLPQLYAEYPEREGLARKCLYWSFFKRFGARERMILSELFGKPWRVIEVDQDSTAGAPEMEDADKIVDSLGSAYTARLPRGTRLNVIQPGNNSGAIHKDIIESSDRQISKLVLGQTGTTDEVAAGLNNNQAGVMQNEQLIILIGDAQGLSEIVETWITNAIIGLNFGPQEVTHAPRYVLRSDLPADRVAEIERLQKSLEAGLSVKLSEAYDASGFSQPTDIDTILRIEQPPTPAGSPNAPNPRPVIVFNAGGSPAQGEQQPPPSTASIEEGGRPDATADITLPADALKSVISVNEARSSQNLGPLMLVEGAEGFPGEDPDGNLTISEFEAKRATATGAGGEGMSDDTLPTPGGGEDGGPGGEGPPQVGDGLSPEVQREVRDAEGIDTDEEDEETDDDSDELEDSEDAELSKRMMKILGEMEGLLDREKMILLVVRKEGNKWVIRSKETGKKLGEFDTREAAEKRLRQIEFFKTEGADAEKVFEAIDQLNAVKHACSLECCGEEGVVELVAGFKQQSSPTGDPEDLVTRGVNSVATEISQMANEYRDAVEGEDTPTQIFSTLNRTWEKQNVDRLVEKLNQFFEQSMIMGALDNRADQEGDLVRDESQEIVDEQGAMPTKKELAEFTADNIFLIEEGKDILLATGGAPPNVADMKFTDAVKFFKSLNVMSRASFDNVSAEVKRRAFTVAGNLSTQMLAVIQHELVLQIEAGADLRRFRQAMDVRLKSSGFTRTKLPNGTLSASHVDTVFRTNTLNAYNAGRARQASQPNVARVFPVWEIRTAGDKEVRQKHAALNGKRLLASDPFWRTSYPPFDYNCRCRVITRRSTEGVVDGSTLEAPGSGGFVSGTATLI